MVDVFYNDSRWSFYQILSSGVLRALVWAPYLLLSSCPSIHETFSTSSPECDLVFLYHFLSQFAIKKYCWYLFEVILHSYAIQWIWLYHEESHNQITYVFHLFTSLLSVLQSTCPWGHTSGSDALGRLPFDIASDSKVHLCLLPFLCLASLKVYQSVKWWGHRNIFIFNLFKLFCGIVIDFVVSKHVHSYFN